MNSAVDADTLGFTTVIINSSVICAHKKVKLVVYFSFLLMMVMLAVVLISQAFGYALVPSGSHGYLPAKLSYHCS